MLRKLKIITFLLFITYSASSQNDEWKILGTKDVTFKQDEDVINLRGSEKNISKFKIKCTQGTLKIKKIVIYYKDNSEDEKKPKGTGLITKGMSSFTFKTNKNKIPNKIGLTYEAMGNMVITKRAKIELLGSE